MPHNKGMQDQRFYGEDQPQLWWWNNNLTKYFGWHMAPLRSVQHLNMSNLSLTTTAQQQHPKYNNHCSEHSKHCISYEAVGWHSMSISQRPTRGREKRLTQKTKEKTWMNPRSKLHHQWKQTLGRSPLMDKPGSESIEYLEKHFTAQRPRPSICSQPREPQNQTLMDQAPIWWSMMTGPLRRTRPWDIYGLAKPRSQLPTWKHHLMMPTPTSFFHQQQQLQHHFLLDNSHLLYRTTRKPWNTISTANYRRSTPTRHTCSRPSRSTGQSYGRWILPTTTWWRLSGKAGKTWQAGDHHIYRHTPAADNTTQYQPERQTHHTATDRAQPYGNRPIDDGALYQDIEVDTQSHDDTSLPPGWHIDESGYIVLDDIQDEWQLKGNYIIRKHYLPRHTTYTPTQDTCPIPTSYLTSKRTSRTTDMTYHDSWSKPTSKQFPAAWTGTTEFKIQPAYRKMAHEHFYNVSEGYTTYIEKKKNNPSNLSERSMSLAERLQFLEAKKKELRSFFENDVWTMVGENKAEPQRILKAHFILKWSTNADGTPRAKARLITQGFCDPDAWSGALRTNSPTLTRLSRGMILSICSTMSWCPFTSDISTAFLQGKAHSKERTLWIRLPRDARQLLGMKDDDSRLMQLHKPMYGLCDAPRAWYMEAVDRILSIPNVVRHPLDACLFMVYDPNQESQLHHEAAAETPQHTPGRLVALFGIHVDDLLGCGDIHNPIYKDVKEQLHKLFNFRMWEETKNLQYCGCDITQHDDHITLQQAAYLHKQKPITIAPHRKAQLQEPQWPSTQSAPHLQCAVSQLAGKVSKGTVSSLELGHKVLRMAKANADVGLHYHALGDVNDISFMVFSDATYASRDDLSSQGGYLLCMVHHEVISGKEDFYNVMDWRSWKLARVARSSLSAESQAASEMMLFCSPVCFGTSSFIHIYLWKTADQRSFNIDQPKWSMQRPSMTCWRRTKYKQA